jgi:hypothetical protein
VVGGDFSKVSVAQKNNDRIAVNLASIFAASFWIDVRAQEVKAPTSSSHPTGCKTGVVLIMGNGVE